MDKDKRLIRKKLPDGRDWLRGKLGLVLKGGAMLSKSLIQFSVDGQGCVPSLLFDLRPNCGGGDEDNEDNDLLQKVPCRPCCTHSVPRTCSRPPLTHTSVWDSETLTAKSGPSLLTTRWWRRTYAHLLLRELQNYNSLLNNRWQKNVGSHEKEIPHVQGQRRSPSKTVGGEKSHLESSAMPARDARRALTNLVRTRTQRPRRDGARTVSECLLRGYGFAVACCRGREPPELTQAWGNRLLKGTIKTLCAPGPRRKEQTPQETGFTIPE